MSATDGYSYNFFPSIRWASLPNPDEFIQLSLSPTGSTMLQAVAIGLQWLQDSLSAPLFTEAWQKFASLINQVLFNVSNVIVGLVNV